MTSVNYIKDDTGSTFIPSSQRPDGTWRRPIRVRDGYVPQEEQPLYVSKGKQQQEYRSRVPVGMTESDVSTYKTSQGSSSQTSSSLYFDVGLYTPAPKATPIPGLNFVETEQDKVPSKSSKKKSKSKNKQADGSGDAPTQKSSAATTTQPPSQQKSNNANAAAPAAAAATDPVKRLRNLRKRLKDIEALEKKIESGELKNPEKEQLEKINRKEEVEDEIDDLERLVEQMNLS